MYSATPSPVSAKITTQNKPLHSKRAPSLIYWAKKNNKTLSRQGSWGSPLEGVAEALRSTLLFREWPPCPFSTPTGPLQSVYVYLNTETSTADLAGQDLCQERTILLKEEGGGKPSGHPGLNYHM